MDFVFKKRPFRLVDEENTIEIAHKDTGIGRDWRQIFEFKGRGVEFLFVARAVEKAHDNKWVVADHWSLEGVPRVPHTNLRAAIDRENLAWAFNVIVRALPHFPVEEGRNGPVFLNDVRFDLRGPKTENPTKYGQK